MFDHTVWAVLTKGEQCPENSRLVCTINHEGRVEWNIEPVMPQSSGIEAVQFNNVTITIPATDATTAYRILCQVLATVEYTTDTFQTSGAADELSEPQSTTTLISA